MQENCKECYRSSKTTRENVCSIAKKGIYICIALWSIFAVLLTATLYFYGVKVLLLAIPSIILQLVILKVYCDTFVLAIEENLITETGTRRQTDLDIETGHIEEHTILANVGDIGNWIEGVIAYEAVSSVWFLVVACICKEFSK